jgi:hypothetical protein
MALRRNPTRACQETLPPPPPRATRNLGPHQVADEVKIARRRGGLNATLGQTKRHATTQRRRRKTLSRQIPRPTNDKPFPFFKLPREIRDEVYSSLVVRQGASVRSIIAATPLLQDRKRRLAAQANRERLNRNRVAMGQPPVQARAVETEPVLELNLLRATQRLNEEAKDCLYSNNWFAITLSKLPLTTFETPYGWDLSRITKLQVEIQMKDAAHMNSYIDWTTFFISFPSLRWLRIIPTFHPRYFDWALPELMDWSTAHYIHKAFFRELMVSVPTDVNLRMGVVSGNVAELQLQGRVIDERLVQDMYAEFGPWRAITSSRRR